MTDILEITELDINDNDYNGKNSTNFGGGLELFMNDKVKGNTTMSSKIDLDDLNNLENELNNLVEETPTNSFKPKSDFFNKPSVSFEEPMQFNNLGKSTAQTENNNKTWDGYDKFNNIPLNPDINISMEPKMSNDETQREKFKYLRKLESLEKKGIQLSKKYNMDYPLEEMIGEYETIVEEKRMQNSIKFQGNMLMAIINGIEFLNSKFDPFDIKLDGWSEQIQENISEYDEIFSELHERYKSKASLGPELKLLFQLGGSAMMVHMTNTMFKSAMPGMDDIFRQNPDLMKSFQTAAVNSMAETNPGFAGFMNNVSQSLPPPIATQGPNSIPPPQGRAGNNSFARPDLNYSRSNYTDDGISLRENYERPDFQDRTSRRPEQRAEMKGPSDISDILSGLKTKTINIQETIQQLPTNNDSTISINDLKDLQQTGGNMPKRSGRRKKSLNNTVSLDI